MPLSSIATQTTNKQSQKQNPPGFEQQRRASPLGPERSLHVFLAADLGALAARDEATHEQNRHQRRRGSRAPRSGPSHRRHAGEARADLKRLNLFDPTGATRWRQLDPASRGFVRVFRSSSTRCGARSGGDFAGDQCDLLGGER